MDRRLRLDLPRAPPFAWRRVAGTAVGTIELALAANRPAPGTATSISSAPPRPWRAVALMRHGCSAPGAGGSGETLWIPATAGRCSSLVKNTPLPSLIEPGARLLDPDA